MPARRDMPRNCRSTPEQADLQIEKSRVVAADLPEQLPVVGPQPAALVAAFGERLAGRLLVDPRQAVVELVLLVQPDAADLVQLFQGDQLQCRGTPAALPGGPARWASSTRRSQCSRHSLVYGPGMVRSWNSCTRPFIRRKSRRSRSSGSSSSLRSSRSGRHPDLLLVVLDHRLHRPVLVHDRADPAAEPAGAAAGRGGVDDQRALAALGRALVHAQERLVVVAPGVFDLHQVEPDVVVGPVLDRGVDERVGQAGIGAQPARGPGGPRAGPSAPPAAGSRPCGCRAPGWPRRTGGPRRG